jgi:biotin synthase
MPNITPVKYRKSYLLYEGKPCTGDDPEMCGACLEKRISSVGGEVGYDEWGDSLHFARRNSGG